MDETITSAIQGQVQGASSTLMSFGVQVMPLLVKVAAAWLGIQVLIMIIGKLGDALAHGMQMRRMLPAEIEDSATGRKAPELSAWYDD
jgi:hypothetical protein